MTETARTARHEAFARRLNEACDVNQDVPRLYYGRNTWITDRIKQDYGLPLTAETVRKWLDGEVMPRPERMAALANVLGVDLNWLALGSGGTRPVSRYRDPHSPAMTAKPAAPPEDAAKHLGLGLVQLGGGQVVEVPPSGPVHFRAEIKGAQYAFHAIVGTQQGRGWEFVVPPEAENTFVLGLVPLGPARFRLLDIDWDEAQNLGEPTDAGRRITVDGDMRTGDHAWREIITFARRL